MRLLIALCATLLVLQHGAFAQGQSAAQRRDELARVQELINDADPLMRIANFEEIAAEGDAAKLQIAIKVALTGNDRTLRGLAFRAYLAGVQRFQADLMIDANLQKQYDAAKSAGERQLRELNDRVRYLGRFVENTAMKADFQVSEFDMKKGRGKARINWFGNGRRDFEFQINGDRLIAVFGVDSVASPDDCPIELRPTNDLQIAGQFICKNTGFGTVKVTAPMF